MEIISRILENKYCRGFWHPSSVKCWVKNCYELRVNELLLRAGNSLHLGLQEAVIASPEGVAISLWDCGACSEQSEESPGLLRLRLATAIAPRNDLPGRM